jgi:hypothetical protein
VFGCLFLAVLFWLLVRAFGWASYGRKGKGAANV